MSKEILKDFSVVELKLAIKRIIRCYMNDLGRNPTLKEIDSHYRKAIIEFVGEKKKWFHKERADSKSSRKRAGFQKEKKETDDPQLKLINL